jgi:hypothetical protein
VAIAAFGVVAAGAMPASRISGSRCELQHQELMLLWGSSNPLSLLRSL